MASSRLQPSPTRQALHLWFLFSLFLLTLMPRAAHAVPSFARQTGMQCSGCHTVFPQLNSFGRQFKLRAYTLGSANTDAAFPANLPVSAILQIGVIASFQQIDTVAAGQAVASPMRRLGM